MCRKVLFPRSPSAGVTITTALVSALTGIPVRGKVAMTGEVTLRGRVLPIGGLREKTMAAYRNRINTVVIPRQNVSDLHEVDEAVKKAIRFVPADTVADVLETALCSMPHPTGKRHEENHLGQKAESKSFEITVPKAETTDRPQASR